MEIKIYNKNLTALSLLFNTDCEDCAAWIEEILLDLRGDDEDDEESTFDMLGDNLYETQLKELTQRIIEHYFDKPEEFKNRTRAYSLIYGLSVK